MSSANIRTWVFDLDNTLYPARALYDEIGDRMTRYIARTVGVADSEALVLRERYFHQYGATIVGLMKHHDADADRADKIQKSVKDRGLSLADPLGINCFFGGRHSNDRKRIT